MQPKSSRRSASFTKEEIDEAQAEVNREARNTPDRFVPCPQPPLQALRALC